MESRDTISQTLPEELAALVEVYIPLDRDQSSPTAALINELRFNRTPDRAHPCLLYIMCDGRVFKQQNRYDPYLGIFHAARAYNMFIQTNKTYETDQQTKARLANELEQDRIAKALEPVVAEYHMRKLPEVLVGMIRWWATEPTPTAKIMKDVSIMCRVFSDSYFSPYGPGKKCLIIAELWSPMWGAWFRDMREPCGGRCEKVFAINDIPLDAEATNWFLRH